MEVTARRAAKHEDESPDDHTWSWLAELAQARGLTVSEDDLRALDYEVVLTDAVRDWLAVDPSP